MKKALRERLCEKDVVKNDVMRKKKYVVRKTLSERRSEGDVVRKDVVKNTL